MVPASAAGPNLDVQHALAEIVAATYLPRLHANERLDVGALSANYFSFTFPVDVISAGGRNGVFVKIPKADLRLSGHTILPVTAADRQMADDEVRSLRALATDWPLDELGVRFVTIRGFNPDYNAIVTERVYAAEALNVLRRLDLRRRTGRAVDGRRLISLLGRLGSALGRFHKRAAAAREFDPSRAVPKLLRYCQELATMTRSELPGRAAGALSAHDWSPVAGYEASTLKGIDLRNLLIDGSDGVFLLDPGRMKRTCREADLARFLLTYRILYWGHWLFALGCEPDPAAEGQFLESYYASSEPASGRILEFYLVKEALKHWHTAHASLRLKTWPAPVKRLVAAAYIDRFYERQLAVGLERLLA